jgi:hypothetical protein
VGRRPLEWLAHKRASLAASKLTGDVSGQRMKTSTLAKFNSLLLRRRTKGVGLSEGRGGLDDKSAASMKQQLLMIVKKTGMERFLTGLLQAKWSDGEVSPVITNGVGTGACAGMLSGVTTRQGLFWIRY